MIKAISNTGSRLAFIATIFSGCGAVAGSTSDGEPCETDADCSETVCVDWFADKDGDGHGDPSALVRLCSPSGTLDAAHREDPHGASLVTAGDDCCDAAGSAREVATLIHPGQTAFFDVPQSVCPDVDPYDYDCDGAETSDHRPAGTECTDLNLNECDALRVWAGGSMGDPPCGAFQVAFGCVASGDMCAYEGEISERYDENRCR